MSRSRQLTTRRWLPVLLAVLAVSFTVSLVVYLVADRPLVGVDPAFYQHVGWYVTRGGVPYVDVWDVNPPLTFAVAALLALLARGNLVVQHALAASVTFAAVGASVVLTAWLAYDLTGDDAAALAAALVLLLPPWVYGAPPWGPRSQFFALLFGVLALVLGRRDRALASGASAVVAAGFWQPGGAVAVLVVGMAARRGGLLGGLRAIAGGLSVAVVVALPFLAAGAFVPMVAQTVVAPFYGQEPSTLLSRAYVLVLVMGYGTVLLPVALHGWTRSTGAFGERWWIAAGGFLYGLQAFLVNLNGSLDALLFLVFVGLGVAVTVVALPSERRWWAVAVVGLLVVTGPAWSLAPGAPLRATVETGYERAEPDSAPALVAADRYPPDVRTIYWEKRRPETCHYRLSHTELRWIARTNATLDETRCGLWPG